jgi:P pilus assembly chaperone PapD
MLHPTRIVFDKNQRAAQIELINNGSKPATYRISLVNRRMTETASSKAAETRQQPGERFADEMLRYSPRQITLQPGTAQTVRVMLRKPAELAEGEYRSHLQFDKLPDVEGNASIENQGRRRQGIGVVLNALVGASVPVIVRHGATSATSSWPD